MEQVEQPFIEFSTKAFDRCQVFSLDPSDTELDLPISVRSRLLRHENFAKRDGWVPQKNLTQDLLSAATPTGRAKDAIQHGDVLILFREDPLVLLYHEKDQRFYRAIGGLVPSQFDVPFSFPPRYWSSIGLNLFEIDGSDLLSRNYRVLGPRDVFHQNGRLAVSIGYDGIGYFVVDSSDSLTEESDFLVRIGEAKRFRSSLDDQLQDWVLEMVPS